MRIVDYGAVIARWLRVAAIIFVSIPLFTFAYSFFVAVHEGPNYQAEKEITITRMKSISFFARDNEFYPLKRRSYLFVGYRYQDHTGAWQRGQTRWLIDGDSRPLSRNAPRGIRLDHLKVGDSLTLTIPVAAEDGTWFLNDDASISLFFFEFFLFFGGWLLLVIFLVRTPHFRRYGRLIIAMPFVYLGTRIVVGIMMQ